MTHFEEPIQVNTLVRSLAPLPSRTVNQRRSRSTSLMRRRSASEIRNPEPYRRLTVTSYGGEGRARILRTSGRISTAGTRTGRFDRTTSSSHGSSNLSSSQCKIKNPVKRLIQRGRSHLPSDSEIGQESFHFMFAHLTWMSLALKQDEPLGPSHIRLFSTVAVVLGPNNPAHAVQSFLGHVLPSNQI